MTQSLLRMRLDKWLWAARFYRSRSLAKQAIESGRVHVNDARVKTSKEIGSGDKVSVRQGSDTTAQQKTVQVLALSEQRGPATVAQLLYAETEESIARRAYFKTQHQLANLAKPDHKPNKKQRRDLHKFKQQRDE